MTDNLTKGCPFCGGEPKFYQDRRDTWWFECKHCHVTRGHFRTRDEAEMAWENRVAAKWAKPGEITV